MLQKVSSEPGPNADKLETLISYALVVQNLCATKEASGLILHLSNPSLLADTLPPQIKLNWVSTNRLCLDQIYQPLALGYSIWRWLPARSQLHP